MLRTDLNFLNPSVEVVSTAKAVHFLSCCKRNNRTPCPCPFENVRCRNVQGSTHPHNLFFCNPSVPDTITINHKDSRWVGAWWLGFIITGTVVMLSGIPFWFLPKSLPKPRKDEDQTKSTELAPSAEQENFLPEEDQEHQGKNEKPVTFQELAKGTKTSPSWP